MGNRKKQSYPITYRPHIFARLFTGIVGIIVLTAHSSFIGIVLFSIFTQPIPFSELTAALILSMVALVLWFYLLKWYWFRLIEYVLFSSIKIMPNGILVKHFGRRFYRWDAMMRIGEQKSSWGIYTDKVTVQKENPFAGLIYGSRRYQTFIPLSEIVDVQHRLAIRQFQQTEFGQILYDHAPHLFENEKPKHQLSDDVKYQNSHLSEDDSQLKHKQHG